jgi:hypothetical protein
MTPSTTAAATNPPQHAMAWYNDLARRRGWQALKPADFNPDQLDALSRSANLQDYAGLREELQSAAAELRKQGVAMTPGATPSGPYLPSRTLEWYNDLARRRGWQTFEMSDMTAAQFTSLARSENLRLYPKLRERLGNSAAVMLTGIATKLA